MRCSSWRVQGRGGCCPPNRQDLGACRSSSICIVRRGSRTLRNNSSSKCTAHSTSTGNLADRLWKAEAAARAFDIREAEDEEYWDIADVHCRSFYPHIQQPAGFFLRLDRVMALHLGKVIEKNRKETNGAKFRCLVAACSERPDGSLSLDGLLWSAVEKLTLAMTGFEKRRLNHVYAAIVVDTLGQYIPRRLQGQVSKASKAYISNLAVTNHQRRRGIGRALLVRAEAMALQWECDEIYLHCDPKNFAAYHLYLAAGYEQVDAAAIDKAFQPRQDIHLVLMCKSTSTCCTASED